MKTKYLIAMLAAPLFFTGCSQDEWGDSVPGTEKIEGVTYGDNLVFNVGDKGDASTRLTTSGAWSEGDRIGMAWITDGYKNGSSDVTGDFNAFANATKVIGNTPLDFVSQNSFKSSTMMFVGTYLAYYPFNEDLKAVGELKLSVGANQESDDLEAAYNKIIFASDTLSLKAENAGTGKTPVINMKRLSNMLALDIYLKAASTTMTAPVIQKVELDLKDNTADNPASLLAVSGTVVPKNWTIAKTNDAEKKYFKSLTGTDDYLTPGDKSMISVTTKEDLAVSTTQAATVYLNFMPSVLTNLTDANCVLKIYTNYGVISYSATAAQNGIALYNWDATKKAYSTTATTVKATFGDADKVAGRLIKKKAVIDLTKVSVDGLTATNATEIRNIVNNWKLLGNSAPAITINVEHPADYQKEFDDNEGKATAKNIELAGLDLSDIPNALTINAIDTLVFTGATNLNKVGKVITIQKDGTTKQSVIFEGTTTIGSLTVNGGIAFNENTTVKGTLNQTPDATTDVITVAKGKTLTIDAGNLSSNTENNSKLINSGTISLINSGAINKGVEESNAKLAIVNYTGAGTTQSPWVEGTINVGDGESQGYLAGTTATLFDNAQGTLRFFNGGFVTPGEGTIIAVAQNALQFSAAVERNVTTIEITGEIKFSAFDLDETKGKATKVIMKSGSKLNLDAKTVTLGSVEVAENATIAGSKLVVFKGSDQDGHLAINANATLTVGDNTEINANVLDLPTASKIAGNATTSKVLYKTAGLVGGTYTANVAQKADLAGVE